MGEAKEHIKKAKGEKRRQELGIQGEGKISERMEGKDHLPRLEYQKER